MTYTPGEIRAAERLQAVLPNKFPEHDIDVCDLEAVLPAILRHRADYDAEGMPLPVDAHWLESELQMSIGVKMYRKAVGVMEVLVGLNGKTILEDRHGLQIDGPTCKTRPQLRALIEVMG